MLNNLLGVKMSISLFRIFLLLAFAAVSPFLFANANNAGRVSDEYRGYYEIGYFDIEGKIKRSAIFTIKQADAHCASRVKMSREGTLRDFYSFVAERSRYGSEDNVIDFVHGLEFAAVVCAGGRNVADYAEAARKSVISVGVKYSPADLVVKKRGGGFERLRPLQ